MLKYDDGTPASSPQMAHDVSVFLDFMENGLKPDFRLKEYMFWSTMAVWLAGSFVYLKYHELNLYSCK